MGNITDVVSGETVYGNLSELQPATGDVHV
jgi:hypothetical protein